MREKALQIAAQQDGEQDKLNYLREYLQHLILREMFELNWLTELVFHGGTALRMLHDLNRFSEYLGFHLEQETNNIPLTKN
ncbi:MAG: nucleotidyl transferase AbiEii/AbiGii toxin family protein [Candidatus Bipolaricaulota bacterium]|nr:nucleotidyl transferase AbiEii/AbiGii toxin family protein [Candidatus Bipolaricaulota bacterium]